MGHALEAAGAELGKGDEDRASGHSTGLTTPPELQPFFFRRRCSDCCKPLVNFQSFEIVDFDHFPSFFVGFMEEEILGSSPSSNCRMEAQWQEAHRHVSP